MKTYQTENGAQVKAVRWGTDATALPLGAPFLESTDHPGLVHFLHPTGAKRTVRPGQWIIEFGPKDWEILDDDAFHRIFTEP